MKDWPLWCRGGRPFQWSSASVIDGAATYQPAPLRSVSLASSVSRLSAAVPLPESVSCTADQNSEETSLYLILVGAEGRGTAVWNTAFQRGIIGCALATSASS